MDTFEGMMKAACHIKSYHLNQDKKFASVDEMKIYISFSNLFASNDIRIKNDDIIFTTLTLTRL